MKVAPEVDDAGSLESCFKRTLEDASYSRHRAMWPRLRGLVWIEGSGERNKPKPCEEGGFYAYIRELPSLHTQRQTIPEATRNLKRCDFELLLSRSRLFQSS